MIMKGITVALVSALLSALVSALLLLLLLSPAQAGSTDPLPRWVTDYVAHGGASGPDIIAVTDRLRGEVTYVTRNGNGGSVILLKEKL